MVTDHHRQHRREPVRLRPFANIATVRGRRVCVCDTPNVGVSQPTVSLLEKRWPSSRRSCERLAC